jgi:hypothetical protein
MGNGHGKPSGVRVPNISLVGMMGNQHVEGEIGDDLLRVAFLVIRSLKAVRLAMVIPPDSRRQQGSVASVFTIVLTPFALFLF